MKKLWFLIAMPFLLITLSSCEKENESDKLFDELEVVGVYPKDGSMVDTYLFNNVYVIFNREISYKATFERLSHSIRVFNKTTNKDITDKVYLTNSLKLDGHKVNIKQLVMYLPDCEYLVEIYLPKGKYSFHFFTKSSKP